MRCFLYMLVLVMAFLAAGCGSNAPWGKPIVLCSIFAYYDAARAIGGDKMDVRVLLRCDESHEYESTVGDKVTASKAVLYIKNGMGLDDRFDKLFDGSKARIVTVGSQIPKDMLLTTPRYPWMRPRRGRIRRWGGTTRRGSRGRCCPIRISGWIRWCRSSGEIIRDAVSDLGPGEQIHL